MSNANWAAVSWRAAAATVCMSLRVSPRNTQQTHHAWLASYKDAASLLFLDLGLVFVLLPDLAHVCFSSSFAFICCCSFSKAAKATSCMVAAIPGDPRSGGACLGTLCYFLTLTMPEYCCCTKAMCVLSYTFLLSCPISRTVRRVVASGAARRAAWYLVSSFALHYFLN